MTTSRCIDEEKLASYAELPPDGPARSHLAECARCRARIAAFTAFHSPPDVPAGARPDDADSALAAMLDREIRARASNAPAHGGSLASFLRALVRPSLRPAWAVAVVVVAILGVREAVRRGDEPIVLREEMDAPVAEVVTHAPSMAAGGAILLRWDPVASADRYVAVFYGEDLAELTRTDAVPEASCRLPDALAADLRSGKPLFWRVLAFRGGDEIASARMATLSLKDAR